MQSNNDIISNQEYIWMWLSNNTMGNRVTIRWYGISIHPLPDQFTGIELRPAVNFNIIL